MMKRLLIITAIVSLGSNFFSQKKTVGLEGKRFNLEAGIGISLFPSFIFFNNDYYSRTKLTDLVSTRYNFELGYAVTNKIKASFHYSHANINFDSVDSYRNYDQDELSNITPFFVFNSFKNTKVNSYGIKVNYYLHDFIAPVGGSIGLSYKRTFIYTKNHVFTSINLIEDNWGYETLVIKTDSSELKMSYTTLGFHYENMFFISNKIPLYFKYGISTALRVGRKGTRGESEIDFIELDDDLNIYKQFLGRSYRHDIFEFNFGLGIIF